MKHLTCVLFCLALLPLMLITGSSNGQGHFVDHLPVEQMAELVCKTTKGTKSQLGKISSFAKVADYLSALHQGNHKLHKCRAEHLKALEQLVKVVEAEAGHVCGDAKIQLLEDYHRQFVSKISKHQREQQRRGFKAPKMVKLFFMRYATEVSSSCELSALENIAANEQSFKPADLAKVEKLRQFTDVLGMSNLDKGYSGIYLFWNMVDALDLANEDKFSKYLDMKSSDMKLHVQMKDAQPMIGLQALCKHQLRPIYSKSLLPVLRLVDMGYYPAQSRSSPSLLDKIRNSEPNTRSLFFAAQICETLLPLSLYSDEDLSEDEFVALTKEDASKTVELLHRQQIIKSLEEIATNKPSKLVEATPISLDADSLTFSETLTLEVIKKNVANRGKVMNKMLKNLVKQVMRKIGSVFQKKPKLFHKDFQNHQKLKSFDEERSITEVDEESLQIIEEVDEEEDEEKDEENNLNSIELDHLKRNKRTDPWVYFIAVGFVLVYFVYWVILTALKLAFLSLPSIVLLVSYKLGNDKSWDHLNTIWKFGYLSFERKKNHFN